MKKEENPLSFENLVEAGVGGFDWIAKVFVGLVLAVIGLVGYVAYTLIF